MIFNKNTLFLHLFLCCARCRRLPDFLRRCSLFFVFLVLRIELGSVLWLASSQFFSPPLEILLFTAFSTSAASWSARAERFSS
jgi:hypothetical protein